MKYHLVIAGIIFAALAAGCTSEQLYGTGQNWQRNQCNRMPDGDERQQCLARADAGYDDYAKRSGAGKAPWRAAEPTRYTVAGAGFVSNCGSVRPVDFR